MRLGDLIDTLETMPHDAPVRFDDGRNPTKLCSWRGIYAELTLDSGAPEPPKVRELLEDARAADGKEFQGYKGGDFVMTRHTPVWADGWGEYIAIGISGIVRENGYVVIKTMDMSSYR